MRKYKDILVSKSSLLNDALDSKDKALAERIYKDTTQRFKQTYPAEDCMWFMQRSKQ